MQLHRLKQLVSLGRHDEIVFVQTTKLMRPPIEGDSAPFGDDQRMVVLFFRGSANLIGEFQNLDKVLKVIYSFDSFHSIHFPDMPLRYVEQQVFNLGICKGWLSAAARWLIQSSYSLYCFHQQWHILHT